MNKLAQNVILTTFVCSLFVGVTFIHAQWSSPSAAPPGSNVAAPIHTGSSYQQKSGDLGALRMRANQYCDLSGQNCFSPADVNSSTAPAPSPTFRSCGSSAHGTTRSFANCGTGLFAGDACPMICYRCGVIRRGIEQCQDGRWVTITREQCSCSSGP